MMQKEKMLFNKPNSPDTLLKLIEELRFRDSSGKQCQEVNKGILRELFTEIDSF